MKVSVFWFRRDLRLEDNTALHHALQSGKPVLPLFIFDENILKELPKNDARVTFIYQNLTDINNKLTQRGSSLLCLKGDPSRIFEELSGRFDIASVYTNKDYEPYAIKRDRKVETQLTKKGIPFHNFKDQVIFEESEIVKDDGKPYSVFTPYKNKWFKRFHSEATKPVATTPFENFFSSGFVFPALSEIGFETSEINVKNYQLDLLNSYASDRNLPAKDNTSYLSAHLRFGTISPRQVIAKLSTTDEVFLSELIWREFFMQILFHFPDVVNNNFKSKYDGIKWRNNEKEFKLWCEGQTGFPMVDAGMRQLNQTGYMHNRTRMITAGFLCKHLLIDWRWGEAYFAEKLLDYELSSNNGNWQWAAGTGCDAAPYFRIFNPIEQLKKFDKNLEYVKRWIPEFGTSDYPEPMVEHKMARARALETYQSGINKT